MKEIPIKKEKNKYILFFIFNKKSKIMLNPNIKKAEFIIHVCGAFCAPNLLIV